MESSIYYDHKKIRLLTPAIHMRPHMRLTHPLVDVNLPSSYDDTSHSENSSYNDLPDLKLKFDYNMIVIYLKLLLVIYITNLYCRQISIFYSVQRRNSGSKYAHFFA